MEGFSLLFVLSLAMFIGSYFSGSVPLAVSFSESKLRIVTVFGAGLLVGTSLAVIIPEGVQSIYDAKAELQGGGHHHSHSSHEHNAAPASIALDAHYPPDAGGDKAAAGEAGVPGGSPKADGGAGGAVLQQQQAQAQSILESSQLKKGQDSGKLHPENAPRLVPEQHAKHDELEVKAGGSGKDGVIKPVENAEAKERQKRDESAAAEANGAPKEKRDANQLPEDAHASVDQGSIGGARPTSVTIDVHSVIGMALVTGFVFMLIVDQLSQGATFAQTDPLRPRYKITATVGLVVHAAADGIALGAASTTNHKDVQFIVFVAIMLHKAPAAFGLVTFLLHEGLERHRTRRHLLVFSCAAPVMAVVTYIGIIQGGSATLSSLTTTGVLMLFSAGTFLYVATVHVLPEISLPQQPPAAYAKLPGGDTSASTAASRSGHSHGHGGGGGFTCKELLALILGSALPTLLTVGHSH